MTDNNDAFTTADVPTLRRLVYVHRQMLAESEGNEQSLRMMMSYTAAFCERMITVITELGDRKNKLQRCATMGNYVVRAKPKYGITQLVSAESAADAIEKAKHNPNMWSTPTPTEAREWVFTAELLED